MSNEEEEEYCSNCGMQCEQPLMLYCEHDLCMKCAAEILNRNKSQGINKGHYIICDKCQTETEIDPQTLKEVLSLGLNNSNKNTLNIINTNINNNTYPNIEISNSELQNSSNFKGLNNVINTSDIHLNNYNLNNNRSFNRLDLNDIKSIKKNYEMSNICKEHKEPITYICLECMSKSVCTECVINGFHRNHGVLNIKKAYPLIYDKTHDIANYIDNKIKELQSTEKNIGQKINDINYLNNKCKNDICQAFNEFRNLLNKKEKEILFKIDNNLNYHLNELNKYSNNIQNKLILYSKLIENVNSYLMRKDEVSLINFYNENKNKILSQIDINEINNLNNINFEAIPNLNYEFIDKTSFDAMISAINSLNFEFNTLKGINFENQINFNTFSTRRNFYDNNDINENNNILGINEVNIDDNLDNIILNEEINNRNNL